MKKKYSIALWWWAARWFIHIWVLQYLEEHHIQIWEISWTSMWAIIGAFYAIWKTPDEIKKIAEDINYLKLIDFDLNTWVLKWKKVLKKLESFFWDKKIEDLDMKLKIVATNIETCEKHVFETWKIVDAIRASLSLPWIFTPHKVSEGSFIDGGVTNNLPIDVLSGQHIIGVSALKKITWPLRNTRKIFWFEFNKWFFNLNYQIIHRTIVTMMKQNELKSIQHVEWDFQLISPDFWELDYYSFDKIDEFIELWYTQAEKILDM